MGQGRWARDREEEAEEMSWTYEWGSQLELVLFL